MKHWQTLVALILAVVAFSASARDADFIVGLDQFCPAGTLSKGPSYRFEQGRFVREGWVCASFQQGN
ncbi:MAG TPA: hypothetical protein VNP36_09450 [Burkholderiales bacterium]|nr:hypothetical protein [Burkholderiales bacterium]